MRLAKDSLRWRHLTLVHEVHSQSSKGHNDVDRTEWHKLLKPFSNVKTLCIDDGPAKGLSRCLQLEDGEDPLELLPELQELTCSGNGDTDDAFISFIDARQSSGYPVTLVPDAIMSTPGEEAWKGSVVRRSKGYTTWI